MAIDPAPMIPSYRIHQSPIPEVDRNVFSAERGYALSRIVDSAMLGTSAFLGAFFLTLLIPERATTLPRVGGLSARDVVVATVAMAVALELHGLYRRSNSRLRPSDRWRPLVVARCLPTAVLIALAIEAFGFHGPRVLSLSGAVAMTLPAALLVPLGRHLTNRVIGSPVTRILVVGSGPLSDRVASRLKRCPDTLLVGRVDDSTAPAAQLIGGVAEIPAICDRYRIDRVILASPDADSGSVLDAVRRIQGRIPISEIPHFFELHNWRSESEELQGLTLLHLPPASLSEPARLAKRSMDLVLSSLALLFLAPLMSIVALAIKIDTSGPVLFRQERTGRFGQPFLIFKFRSMTSDAWDERASVAGLNESDGPLFKMEADPRVTRVGAFIRKTSLDELPQLINVLRGEMSLVGPRPLPTEESARLDGAALHRFDVKPGITGLWQVCGRSDLSYADLQHLDAAYAKSWSLMWDFRILLQTPRVVFGRIGAY